jgi:hypothetical protein
MPADQIASSKTTLHKGLGDIRNSYSPMTVTVAMFATVTNSPGVNLGVTFIANEATGDGD